MAARAHRIVIWGMLLAWAALARSHAADSPATLAALDGQSLLERLGFSLSDVERIASDQAAPAGNQQALLRLLFSLRRLPATDWQLVASKAQPFAAPAGESRFQAPLGTVVELAGTLRQLQPVPLAADAAERWEMPGYVRCQIEVPTGGATTSVMVDAMTFPHGWRAGTLDEPVSVVGIYVGDASGDSPRPWLVARRIAWHPDTPLGRLGMDQGRFDQVRHRARFAADESPAFYHCLAAVAKADPQQLWGEAEARIDDDHMQAIVPFFEAPAEQAGRLVAIAGVARRALRVEIEDPVWRSLVGQDHFYEVEVSLHARVAKSDRGSVVVCCDVLRLPPGMPTGEQIGELVRVPGFFFKLWSFDSQFSHERGEGVRQLAPLLIGPGLEWQAPTPADRSLSNAMVAFIATGVTLAAVLIWWNSRPARRLRGTRPGMPATIELPTPPPDTG